MIEKIPTACICANRCGIYVHVEDGEIVKITGIPEHPTNKGRLCPKALASVDFFYNSPERIKHPMKKVNGVFEQISWEEAMELMATKLLDLKEKYGPESLIVMRGMAPGVNENVGTLLVKRWMDVYGTPNYFTVDNQCFYPNMMAYMLTCGVLFRPDGNFDKVGQGLKVYWGRSVDENSPTEAMKVRDARKKGLKLMVVDPRKVPLAKEADLFLQPRPGSDSALLLGIINVIITKGLYDKQFVAEYTKGFDQLVEHVKAYPPEVVEKITWVPAEKIIAFAEAFATTKPAGIHHGYAVLDQQAAGFHAARSMVILHAITGNLDVPGGWISIPSIYRNGRDFRLRHMVDLSKELGTNEFPLMTNVNGRHIGDGQGNIVPETILTGSPYPIKSMVVIGTNPLLSWGEPLKWKEALSKLDFLVAVSLNSSEVTEMADLVLPAASSFEIDDFAIYFTANGDSYIMARRKIKQYGDAHSVAEFSLDIAKKMGYGEYFPWKSHVDFVNWYLEPLGFSFDSVVRDHPIGFNWRDIEYYHYIGKGFPTPSKKIEIYSDEMERYGYDPLPVQIEPTESPYSTPELAKEYPLVLTTGKRIKECIQSEMQNVPMLKKRATEKFNAEIHPETAKLYDIKTGDTIKIESIRNSVEIRAEVTEDILPGIVAVPRGRRGQNINALASFRGNKITGVPEYKAFLCRISKVSKIVHS